MIFAGIDTTWSAIGSGIWHLAQHADERARLVAVADDDMLWNTAIEEMLRFYAPVTMGRKVVADTEVAGCPVRAGEQVLLTFPAANHDPAQFDGRRRVPARPGAQPPHRVRARHPPVHRIEPGAARDDGRPAGMAARLPRLRTRSRPRHRLGERSGARPPVSSRCSSVAIVHENGSRTEAGKVESPGGAAACAAHPPGRLRRTDPPLVERRALAFNSISTSPVSPCGVAGDAAFRVRYRFPATDPVVTDSR